MVRVKTILAATDHSKLVGWAEMRAAMLGAELRATMLEVLTVAPPEAGVEQALDAAQKNGRLRSANIVFGSPAQTKAVRPADGPSCVRTIGFGMPASVVSNRAAELPADLVVVCMRDGRILIGEHDQGDGLDLLRTIDRPLLLVRGEPRDAYRRTLLTTDFDQLAFMAAELGMALAPQAQHTLFHALDAQPEDEPGEGGSAVVHLPRFRVSAAANRRMNEQAAILAPGGQALSRVIRFGDPVTEIRDCVRRLGVDLLTLGRGGASLSGERALGEIAGRLLPELDCDVLIVPNAEDDWDGGAAA